MTSANDLLMGSGVTSAKFNTIGETVGGRIVREPEARQQTDFDTQKPKFYENGDPMMQIIVQVQTAERTNPEDDGVRAIYVRGQMTKAVREAVRSVGGNGLEVGGELYITWSGTEPNSRGRGQDKKVYTARYARATAHAANAALMAEPAPQAAVAPQPVAQPQYAPGFAPQQPFAGPAAIPASDPAPAGVDPNRWAGLSPEQRAQYRALLGQPA